MYMIEIITIGGYTHIGGNMTAVKYGDEIVIFDMGIYLESFIEYKGDKEVYQLPDDEMQKMGAIPNDSILDDMRSMVKAIVPTHAHLDHVGGIPFLSNHYDCPIIATPYTAEVLDSLADNYGKNMENRCVRLMSGSTYTISDNLSLEFVQMTHSTPQSTMAALHTPEGVVIYANDFKLDEHPSLGKKPDYGRLGELSKEGVKCLILDSTYAPLDKHTPSESVAQEKLSDVLLKEDTKGKAVIVSTFSSHLARLKAIIEIGKKMKRKVVFLGRSLARYIEAGEAIGLIKFTDDIELVKYGKQIRKKLQHIGENKEEYLLVVTGHQGEPDATLAKMANGLYEFPWSPSDIVVFSCTVIPSPLNKENRDKLERTLEKHKVTMFKDIHVSGHGAAKDHKELLEIVKPEHLVPSHGNVKMRTALSAVAEKLGYIPNKTIHLPTDGDSVILT